MFSKKAAQLVCKHVIANNFLKTNIYTAHHLRHTSLVNSTKVRLTPNPLLVPFRSKSKKKKTQVAVTESETEEEEKEDAWDKAITDKSSKLMNVDVQSLRVDAVLKSGLGIARNKVEALFYENKIRLNGRPVLKKSDLVQEGDEVDVIKEVNIENPELLTVARVEVLGVKPKQEGFKIKLRRCKSLVVDNYEQQPK